MLFTAGIISYVLFSAIVLILFGLSILSSINTGHYFMAVFKLIITFFLSYEVLNEWKVYLSGKRKVLSACKLTLDDLYIFLSVLLAGMFTYFLNHDLALGAVLASSAVGIFGAFVFKKYQIAIYCGSFAGMVASTVIDSYAGIIIVGIFTGLLFVVSKEVYKGFGGKLGATAFFGTTVSALVIGTFSSTVASSEISIDYWLIVYFLVGSVGTFLIKEKTKASAVLASAALGLIAALLLPVIHGDYGITLTIGLFCGTFAGMSSVDRLCSLRCVFMAGIISTIIFSYTQPYFNGLGGKLGAIAFGSSIASAGFLNFNRRFLKKGKNI